jgi:hypothetical protein
MVKKNGELNIPDNVKFLTTEEGQKLVDKLVKQNRGEEVIDLETLFAEDNTPIETNMPCKNHINALVNGIDHFTSNPIITDDELDKFAKKVAENWEAMKKDIYEKKKNSEKNCECPKSFDDFCKYIMDLHHRKNTDYGNAFHELYKKFGALNYVYPRLYEKLSRVESLLRNKKDAKTSDCALVTDEKISDTLLDIATYCIMTVEEMQYD